jgi:hypothetical protein
MTETSNFYLDGSPKHEMNFVSREKPGPIDWLNFNIDPEKEWSDEVEVEFIRGCMFFCAEQKTDKDGKKITLGKLREFFTAKAIKLLEKDGYIKLIIDHGEPG